MNPENLQARKAQCVYCTDEAITFLGSAQPQLAFDINIALVQTRYRGDRQPRTFPNFGCRPHTAVINPVNLQARKAQCLYCTDEAIAFLGSA